MAIEVNSTNIICSKCGRSYGRRKGYFAVNYGSIYKGIGYLNICKDCVDEMYNTYLAQCNNARDAARQMCRKLDLYWSDSVFDMVEKKTTSRTLMTSYIAKINTNKFIGKSYDDTLSEEGVLWDLSKATGIDSVSANVDENDEPEIEIADDVIAFWGKGYDPEMYLDLEQRRNYWMSKFPLGVDLDIGTEALIRQICSMELDINRERAAGRPVDKQVNALNNLLGSANLKPNQKKDDSDAAIDKTPMGMWIWKLENQRPVKEVDPELADVDGIKKYVTVWLFGHLCKMLNIKNSYSKLYEEEIAKMRVERPEYDEEDDDTMLYDIFSNGDSIADGS